MNLHEADRADSYHGHVQRIGPAPALEEAVAGRPDETDDEEVEGKESVALFHEALGGEMIELKNHGHYVLGHMGTEEFPELIEQI